MCLLRKHENEEAMYFCFSAGYWCNQTEWEFIPPSEQQPNTEHQDAVEKLESIAMCHTRKFEKLLLKIQGFSELRETGMRKCGQGKLKLEKLGTCPFIVRGFSTRFS